MVGLVLSLTCQGHQIRGHHVGPHVSLLDPLAVAGQPQADSEPTTAIKEARKAASRWVDLTPDDRQVWHEGHYPGMKHSTEPDQVAYVAQQAPPAGAVTFGSGPSRPDMAANGNPPTEGSGLATLSFTILALLAARTRRRGGAIVPPYEERGPQTVPSPEPPPPR
jgi:hypothetical protein